MSERTWRGNWWVAEESDVVVPGILHCAEDGRPRLELVGGFDTEIRIPLPSGNGYSVSSESRTFPLIHGLSGSDLFTLIDTHATHTSGLGFFREDIVVQDLSPNRALRGIHLNSVDEPVFTRAHLQLERLLQWSARTTFDLRLLMEGNRVHEQTAATHQLPPINATYGKTSIGLRVRSHDFNIVNRPVANRRSMETEEWATLDFDTPEPVSFNAFDTIDKDIQDLLTLSAYEACGSHGQSLIFPTSEAGPGPLDTKEVEVLGRQTFRTGAKEKESRHHNFLFTLDDLDFPELVPRWLELKDSARLGFNILFGLRYISVGYIGPRLIGVATAAESIHHAICPNSTPLPKPVYKALKARLLDAIPDEPESVREFVKRGLRNDPTYNERMLELASIPDSVAVDKLLTDRAEWAARLKNARHDLAHANERSAQDPDSSEAFWLLEVTYALLCLVAMSKLGLSPEIQRRAVGNPKIQWASLHFKKVLTTPESEEADA